MEQSKKNEVAQQALNEVEIVSYKVDEVIASDPDVETLVALYNRLNEVLDKVYKQVGWYRHASV